VRVNGHGEWALIALGLAGCAVTQESAPEGVARLAQQLSSGADTTPEAAELGQRLGRVEPGRIEARARVSTEGGAELAWTFEQGAYRLEAGLFGVAVADSPENAAHALGAALERRDLPALESLLSRAARARWERRLERLAIELSDRELLRIEGEGDRRTVTTPDGTRFDLVREDGTWRLVEGLPE
jgi:hypothetical protein